MGQELNRAIYAYGANDEKYLTKTEANQLAMWLGIEYAKNNLRYLDFGKTPLSNKSQLIKKDGCKN